MNLRDVQDQALQLSDRDRLELISVLINSLRHAQSLPQRSLTSHPKPQGVAQSLIGIAKIDAPPPTDAEVKAMLVERRDRQLL
ncbi:hypothetical protein OOK60_09520 [Trichothermofontia sichuanensis B231]|uniref:hypothetical protein n=1 Tax=Trichothermofontia sichuanensis TaxID=3045816 RepID=UPI0022456C60|nr:hypothetical protein [Trichothermofontia sichuanensis]UZQ52777.1 hypothetical protein OOK60_09520 [Trichothermofontia sichuanensis B231]